MTSRLNLSAIQGKTFTQVLRYGSEPYLYIPITAITKTAPVRITATAHGLPDGWFAAPQSVVGMTQINAANSPPRGSDWHTITVIDADTIDLNDINALGFDAYVSGGVLQTLTPESLTGRQAQVTISDTPGGTVKLTLTSSPAAGVTLDNTAKTIAIKITAAQLTALGAGAFALAVDIIEANADIMPLAAGVLQVTQE